MTASRLRFRLLATAAAAAGSLTLTTGASAATWGGQQQLTGPGAQAPTITATPDGTVVAAWVQSDGGHVRVFARTRSAATRSWGPAQPVSSDGVEASPYTLRATSSSQGDVVVAWTKNDNSAAYASVLEQGDTTWQDPVLLTDSNTSVTGGAIAPGPDGTVGILLATFSSGNHAVVLSTRRADGTFAAPVPVSDVTSDMNTELALAYAPNGRAVAAWRTNLAGDDELRVALADPDGAWSGEHAVYADSADFGMTTAAITSGGKAALFWTLSMGAAVKAAFYDGSSWAGQTVSPDGEGGLLTFVRATADGRFVLAWQGMQLSDPYTTVRPYTRVFDPSGAGGWAGARTALTPSMGGAPVLAGNARGDMLVSMLSTEDGSTMLVKGSLRPVGAGVFGSAETASATLPVGTSSGVPIGAMDELGNGYVVFGSNAGELGFAVADRSAPEITDVSVPEAAVSGQDAAVSASAEDLWSGTTLSWQFGDGSGAEGGSASHAYSAPGTYTVTVTATDGSGNVASVSRQVVVSAPPSDDDADDTPPVVIAPVIEARLAGKTLALNARVTLKAGQKCKGTITVTTAFGGKTYKAPAKLALKNGACRATAQITLKKTPSLRTKLRVTVGATKADKKKLSPRTITSRRG